MKIILVLLFFAAVPAHAKEVGVVYRNNMAVRKMQKERALDGYGEFVSLLARSPFDPTLQFNVGAALGALGEFEKAETLYKQLLTQVDQYAQRPGVDKETLQELGKVRFGILYNLGVYYQGKKEIDLALENYQMALEMNPDSKEIKTNIEMMLAQNQGGGKGGDKDQEDKNQDEKKDDKQDQKQDEKDKKDSDKDKKEKKESKPEQGKKEFDQKQMSMEDLKRIMEELKDQEQGIRAKIQGKGGKNGKKDKEW